MSTYYIVDLISIPVQRIEGSCRSTRTYTIIYNLANETHKIISSSYTHNHFVALTCKWLYGCVSKSINPYNSKLYSRCSWQHIIKKTNKKNIWFVWLLKQNSPYGVILLKSSLKDVYSALSLIEHSPNLQNSWLSFKTKLACMLFWYNHIKKRYLEMSA